jgi:hypothetical protein
VNRLAHAHAVRVLRQLGRELVAGSWSRAAEPMSAPQAAVIISRALVTVMDVGLGTVADAIDERLRELLG